VTVSPTVVCLTALLQLKCLDPVDGDLDDDDDDSFHYPQSETPRTVASGSQTDYFSRPGVSRLPADLTPQLMQAPDFRVPTHEAPQKLRYTPPTPHPLHATWERDEAVRACRDCQRRFNFLNRRVSHSVCLHSMFLT